jgi:hypothetical protein
VHLFRLSPNTATSIQMTPESSVKNYAFKPKGSIMSELATEHVIEIILLIGTLIMFYLVSEILESVRQVSKNTALMQTTLVSTQAAIKRLAKKLGLISWMIDFPPLRKTRHRSMRAVLKVSSVLLNA